MVEYTVRLDSIFSSLADPTRRDILRRVSQSELTVGDIAKSYTMTLAAISKHLKVLEQAKLVIKRRRGKEQIVRAAPETLKHAAEYLRQYDVLWNERYDALEVYLRQK
jgi:DNA-binding transcriptional ArsR family regulator